MTDYPAAYNRVKRERDEAIALLHKATSQMAEPDQSASVREAAQAVVDAHAAIIRAVTPSDPEFLYSSGPKMVPEHRDRYQELFSQWHSTTRALKRALDEDRDA